MLPTVLITFGTDCLKDAISVTIVRTVVTPRAIRAGTASLETQNDSQDNVTIKNVGA